MTHFLDLFTDPATGVYAEPVKLKFVFLNSQTLNYAIQIAQILKIKVHGTLFRGGLH